jgi:hypothetical protein
MQQHKLYILLMLSFLSQVALAQQARNGDDTLSTEEVIIVKEFEPTIAAARRLNTKPKTVELKTTPLTFSYEEREVNFESTFQPDSIKAARLKGEPLNRLYRAYVKAGMGNYLTTFGEAYINNLRSRNTLWGIGLKHRAANNSMNDLPVNKFARNRAEVYGTRFLKAHKLTGEVAYDHQRVHYYGWNQNYLDSIDYDNVDDDQLKQVYHEIASNLGIESFFSDSNVLNYKVNLSHQFLTTPTYEGVADLKTSENRLLVQSSFSRYFDQELAIVNFDIDYNNQQFDTNGTENRINDPNLFIRVNPQVEFKGSKWRLSLGLAAFIESEEDTEFRFYPNAYFKYNVFDDYLIPYLGIKGGLTRTNVNSLRKENPFLSDYILLENQNTRYNAYGGIRGAFTSQISFNIQASIRQEANAPLFVKAAYNPLLLGMPASSFARGMSAFDVVYDTLNVTQITAELNFFQESKLNVLTRLDYWSYNPLNEAKAWHKPQLKLMASGRYDLHNKIVTTLDVFYVGKRYAKTNDPSEGDQVASDVIDNVVVPTYAEELKGYVDINLGLEYRYNKKLSGFIQANNLINQEYDVWHGYDAQGINLLFGITYGFWSRN